MSPKNILIEMITGAMFIAATIGLFALFWVLGY